MPESVDAQNWRAMFVGRQVERQFLKDAWEKVCKGQVQVVEIVAETGWGKTRVVQQFYEDLQAKYDPHGYWPQSLGDPKELQSVRRSNLVPSFEGHSGPSHIPFLWLAVRFDPDLRVPGLFQVERQLATHLRDILWTKKTRQVEHELAVESADFGYEASVEWTEALAEMVKEVGASAILEAIPFVKIAYYTAKGVRTLAKAHRNRKSVEAERRLTLLEVSRNQVTSVSDAFLGALKATLAGGRQTGTPLPVVLSLDDSQWADPTTLDVIQKLIGRARAESWPLLVIFTRWEKVYAHDLPTDQPRSVLDLRSSQPQMQGWTTIHLKACEDLESLVSVAFPGMEENQKKQLLELSDRQPLYLVQLILHAKRHPTYFEARDTDGELTPDGLRQLGNIGTLNDLAKRRFEEDLTDEMRYVLAWGSFQGMQFLHKLTRAIALDERLKPVYGVDVHDAALAEAADEQAFLDRLTQIESSAFDQRTYYQQARTFLEDEGDGVMTILRAVIQEKLVSLISEEDFLKLPIEEQISMAEYASEVLQPSGEPNVTAEEWQTWAKMSRRITSLFSRQRLWDRSEQIIVSIAPKYDVWPDEIIPYAEQIDMCQDLISYREFGPAYQWLSLLSKQSLDDFLLGVVHMLEGNIHSAESNWYHALGSYAKGRKSAEQGIASSGDSRELLSLLANCLGALGDTQQAISAKSGHDTYAKALTVSRKAVELYGRNPDALRSLAVNLLSVGRGLIEADQSDEAFTSFDEALSIFTEIVDVNGRSQEALRDIWTIRLNIGDLKCDRTEFEAAAEQYLQGFEVMNEVIEAYGYSARTLADLQASHYKWGVLAFSIRNGPEALSSFGKSFSIAWEIRERFGTSFEVLWMLATSQKGIGMVHWRTNAWEDAKTAFRSALVFTGHLLTAQGRSRITLRLHRELKNSLANCVPVEEAEPLLIEAAELGQEILESIEVFVVSMETGLCSFSRDATDVLFLGEIYTDLLSLYSTLDDLSQSESCFGKAWDLCTELRNRFPDFSPGMYLRKKLIEYDLPFAEEIRGREMTRDTNVERAREINIHFEIRLRVETLNLRNVTTELEASMAAEEVTALRKSALDVLAIWKRIIGNLEIYSNNVSPQLTSQLLKIGAEVIAEVEASAAGTLDGAFLISANKAVLQGLDRHGNW